MMLEIQSSHTVPGVISSDEYYTPKEFIDSLGVFDLDPCAPVGHRWRTAVTMFTSEDDGLSREWTGRVWLNPPYSRELFEAFMRKMSLHGNGIALVLPKFGTRVFRDYVFPYADGIFVLKDRIRFYDKDYIRQRKPIATSVLIAYGIENVMSILDSGLEGTMLLIKH